MSDTGRSKAKACLEWVDFYNHVTGSYSDIDLVPGPIVEISSKAFDGFIGKIDMVRSNDLTSRQS